MSRALVLQLVKILGVTFSLILSKCSPFKALSSCLSVTKNKKWQTFWLSIHHFLCRELVKLTHPSFLLLLEFCWSMNVLQVRGQNLEENRRWSVLEKLKFWQRQAIFYFNSISDSDAKCVKTATRHPDCIKEVLANLQAEENSESEKEC